MKLNIAVLAGDGIGPEIMKQGVAVMQAIAEKFNHEFTYNEAIQPVRRSYLPHTY